VCVLCVVPMLFIHDVYVACALIVRGYCVHVLGMCCACFVNVVCMLC